MPPATSASPHPGSHQPAQRLHHRDFGVDSVATRLNIGTAAGLALLWVVLLPIARRAHRRIAQQHLVDDVTGLPSRAVLPSLLDDGIQQVGRTGHQLVILFVDLDGFKRVNDTVGHHIADDVLRETADRLRGLVGVGDHVCRFAGDEFVVIASVRGGQGADGLATRVVEAISTPFAVTPGLRLSASVGLACADDPSTRSLDILRQADLAMYHAKALGGGRHATFDEELEASARCRQWVEAELGTTIASEQGLWVAYQPQVRVIRRGSETLCRAGPASERGRCRPATASTVRVRRSARPPPRSG